jgi:hypothetical protein
MCLRIQFCTDHRVCILHLKKKVKFDVPFSACTSQYQNNLNNHKERCFITQSTDICFPQTQEMHQAGQKSYFSLITDQCISCGKSGIPIPGNPILLFYEDKRSRHSTNLRFVLNPTISCHFSTIQRPLTPFPLHNKHPT